MNNDPKKVVSKGGIKFRKLIYPILRAIAIIISPSKLHIVRKAEVPKGSPVIYSSTHGFRDDVAVAVMATNNPFYFLVGNAKHFLNSFDGILVWLNGAAVFDREDSNSRKSALPKMRYAIELGANILIYTEGTWNLTDSLLVLKLFGGIYDLAKATSTLVAPIITHIEGKNCYAILDEPFDITAYNREEGIAILRDKMATAKFELMEKYSYYSRKDLEANGKSLRVSWEEYKEVMISQVKHYYPMEHEVFQFKDKSIIEYAEAFAHLDVIEIKKENAFLLRPSRLEVNDD